MIELILSFGAVAGLSREMLQTGVQERLLKMGYKWGYVRTGDSPVQFTNQPLLVLLQRYHKTLHYAGVGYEGRSDHTASTFDVTTQLEEFFQAVADMEKEEIEVMIDGVKATITATTVQLNTDALVRQVHAKAVALQQAQFGR